MLSLQPGSGAPTFDAATTSLGLTAGQNTAIKNLLIQQAQASGGDPTPTNAACALLGDIKYISAAIDDAKESFLTIACLFQCAVIVVARDINIGKVSAGCAAVIALF